MNVSPLAPVQLPQADPSRFEGPYQKPHERLRVWHEAMELASLIYEATQRMPKESRAVQEELRAEAMRLPASVAAAAYHEGEGFRTALMASRALLGAMDCRLELARRMGHLSEEALSTLLGPMDLVGRGLGALVRKMRPAPAVV